MGIWEDDRDEIAKRVAHKHIELYLYRFPLVWTLHHFPSLKKYYNA